MLRCDVCGDDVPDLGEDGECDDCALERYQSEFRRLRAQYAAEKAAGLLKPREEYEADLRDAGRGHLI